MAFYVLASQLNSFRKQSQARDYRHQWTIWTVKKEKSCSSIVALWKIHNRILNTVPSCGPKHQADVPRLYFLATAVKYCAWDISVLHSRTELITIVERLDYSKFYSKLCVSCTENCASENEIDGNRDFLNTYVRNQITRPNPTPRNYTLTIYDMIQTKNVLGGKMNRAQAQSVHLIAKSKDIGKMRAPTNTFSTWRTPCLL